MNKFEINNGHITLNGTQIKGVSELTISPASMNPLDKATHVVITMKMVAEMGEPAPAATDTGSKLVSAISAGVQAGLQAALSELT